MLYESQGRYAEAEPLYQRALDIAEKALGPDHPDVGTSLNNLAELYRDQGRYAEAEPLYKRASAISREGAGTRPPRRRHVAEQPGRCCIDSQGRYAEAEPLYQRALAIREKALGPDHPDVGTSLNNLAGLYQQPGPLRRGRAAVPARARHPREGAGARPPRRRHVAEQPGRAVSQPGPLRRGRAAVQARLAIGEKALGPDHPAVGPALNNLDLKVLAKVDGDVLADLDTPVAVRAFVAEVQRRGLKLPKNTPKPEALAKLVEQAGPAAKSLARGSTQKVVRKFRRTAKQWSRGPFGDDQSDTLSEVLDVWWVQLDQEVDVTFHLDDTGELCLVDGPRGTAFYNERLLRKDGLVIQKAFRKLAPKALAAMRTPGKLEALLAAEIEHVAEQEAREARSQAARGAGRYQP